MFIERGQAEIIKNSRGEKTIKFSIKCHHGTFSCSAPSGKSKGKNEVLDYNERGIFWSVKLTNDFFKKLQGKNIILKEFADLEKFEDVMIEFEKDFGKLGGNTRYAIEGAILKSAAKENKKELWEFIFDSIYESKKPKMPMPVGNCIGGGLHSLGINGKKPDFQEFLLIPNEKNFHRAVTKNIHAYHFAKKLVKKKNSKFFIKRNDENAWNTSSTNEETLEILEQVAKKYNLRIGLDVASSSFFDKFGHYLYKNKELIRDRNEQVDYMRILINKFKLFYVEDPLMEEDFPGFKKLLSEIDSAKTMIVGDDLTTTNLRRLERAFRAEAINAIIVKPNQIGSLVETGKVIEFCKKNKIKIIFSHRSGETTDDILGDYAVGFQADFIKTGIIGKERMIKLRRIVQIEKEINYSNEKESKN